MRDFASALYFGTVMHRRLKPRAHRLRYRVFEMLFDLDELPWLAAAHRFFAHNGFNLISFHDRDHGRGDGGLRDYVEAQLAAAGIALDGGPIRLLCSPRILGYVFNPLSVYFCHRRDGALAALLYEVNNTFGERHSYLIPVADSAATTIVQSCPKEFYVSPFIPMAMTYHFRILPPAEAVAVVITESDAEGILLQASFTGRRASISDARLAHAFFGYPLLTLKIVAGIHWEALRLWWKGVALQKRPPAPAQPVTIVRTVAGERDHVVS